MHLALKQLIALSNDRCLTDKMFRNIVQGLALKRRRDETCQDCLTRLRQEEIYERERELYVR